MNYKADFETIMAMVRVFPPGKTFEDNFSWCCSVKTLSKDTCEICGVLKAPNQEELKAIIKVLKQAGFSKAKWISNKNKQNTCEEYVFEDIDQNISSQDYTAEFENVVGICRVFPETQTPEIQTSEYDNWSWCCTIKRVNSETCELCGVLKAPNLSECKAIIKTLQKAGFKKAKWLRIINGQYIWKEFMPEKRY